MKLLRYGPAGEEKPGLVDDNGALRDLSDWVADIGTTLLDPDRLKRLARRDPKDLPIVEGRPRLGPPVADIGKIFGIGLNYADHAAETGKPLPQAPIVFAKLTTAISGPNDPIVIPRNAEKVDWEVELAVVIGRETRYVAAENALEQVAGYMAICDVSERDFQAQGGQWVMGKGCDSFAPLGPWLVTAEDVPDPGNLNLRLEVNGKPMQSGNTRAMIFDVAHLIAHISAHVTLLPGDVIATGTPPGVGAGRTPQQFLKPGDSVTLGVEGLGEQQHRVVAYAETG